VRLVTDATVMLSAVIGEQGKTVLEHPGGESVITIRLRNGNQKEIEVQPLLLSQMPCEWYTTAELLQRLRLAE
jgi:hypothetical protein